MAEIIVGMEASHRGDSFQDSTTIVNKLAVANADGIITSVQLWAEVSLVGCKVGICYLTTGSNLKWRSAVTLGAIAAGSMQTKTVSLAVVTGDLIGIYFSDGTLSRDFSGFGDIWYDNGDQLTVGNETTYTSMTGDALSLKGIGAELASARQRAFIIG